MSKRLAISTACALAALVAGCHKGAPEGQVAATINGEEITLQELNTEIQANNVPQGADKQAAQRQALQNIIDRKLLLDAAREKKIDKSPEYQSQKQRADELLLAQTYAKQQLAVIPVPTNADISKFMGEHPNVFGNREILQLDQIRFRPTSPSEWERVYAAIKPDRNMDTVAQHLTGLGIKFERGKNGLDTAQLPTDIAKQIESRAPGDPFILPSNGGILTVNAVTGHQPAQIDPVEARQAAVGAWRQEQFTKLITDQLKQMRNSAKITYQSGFAPDTKKPGAPAAAPAAPAK